MKDNIYKLTIAVSDENTQEILIALLSQDVAITALEQTDAAIYIYHESKEVLERASQHLYDSGLVTREVVSLDSEARQNWNQAWEASFSPIVVDDFCQIRASFHEPNPAVSYDIVINPELAFGTGHHETTYMMLQHLQEIDSQGLTILDFGCGTAVLAILAEKMGAAEIDAIDYDPQATQCAADCLVLNASKNIKLITGDAQAIPNRQYDLILANVNRKVLLEAANRLFSHTRSGGHTIISGILDADEYKVMRHYTALGFEHVDTKRKGEWLAIKWKRS